MSYNVIPIDSLVNEIKGTSGFLAKVLFRRVNLYLVIIVFGGILVVKLLLK